MPKSPEVSKPEYCHDWDQNTKRLLEYPIPWSMASGNNIIAFLLFHGCSSKTGVCN
jgi:hypothetical protein